MMVITDMHPATRLAEKVYIHFLTTVVETHVARHRVGVQPEKTRKKINAGICADTRFVQLMTMSGKGGYSPDPVEFAKRARYTNVTLLDHLLSVGRGSMLFYGMDCHHKNPDMDGERLKTHLALLLALAFMHDVDKIAGISRKENLTPQTVAQIAETYGITDFCKDFGLELKFGNYRGN